MIGRTMEKRWHFMWAVKDSEELASQEKGILGTGNINCASGRRSQWRTGK